jgi:lycopene cyclase domain-containing protein
MSHLLYLAVLAGCLLATAPVGLVLGITMYARWRRLILAIAPTAVLFTAWDWYAISRHHWTYNPHWITGIQLPGRLPIEEICFFLVIPACAVLTLEAVRARRPNWLIGDER